MTLETVDHVEVGKERAITYFQSKENFINLIEILLSEVQQVEDSFIELSKMKDIDTVTGVWLDYLGSILGEERGALEDEPYRTALRLRIAINTSDGTTPRIASILRSYTDSDFVRFAEGFLSYGQIILNGNMNINKKLYYLVQDIVPVTTKVLLLHNTEDKCFFPAWEKSLADIDSFFLEDGIGGLDLFELTVSESLPPSPFFLTIDGEKVGFSKGVGDSRIPEWETLSTPISLLTPLPWEVTQETLDVRTEILYEPALGRWINSGANYATTFEE